MKTKYSLFSTIFLAALLVAVEVQAGTLDDIGFTDLKLELGSALPDGGSIAVTQAEAPVSVACIPDMTLAEFNLITFNDHTLGLTVCTDGVASGHATSVATKFYGAVTSSVTAISSVDLYEAGNWIGAGFLNTGGAGIGVSTTRLINHSWTAPAAEWAGEILRRVDYLVEVDEFIQVVGVSTNTVTNETPSNSFNAIVAGLSAGTGTTGTKAIDTTYVSGRAKPDIVAPEGVGSTSAPRVSSAAVLLMDYAHTHPLLSNGSVTNSNGDIINNAERSETVKALLMAGADRATVGNTNAVDIMDYRVAGKETSNGLDTRFGAGQVNSYNSHHILAAGEQDSEQDGGITFANTGFDFDPAFGGLNSSNTEATYSFTIGPVGGQKIKAALVWNLDVLTTSTDNLYDLDLQLIDVTDGGTVVASSTSTIDNTENIWFDLKSNNAYQLKVIPGVGQAAFEWDYALAWQIVVPGVTVVETDSTTMTAEDGTTDTFTVVLDSPPAGDVTISLVSSDTAEGTVSPSSLTFTSANWSTLQTVTVTGVNDAVDDGDKNYSIDFTVSSVADANYHGMTLSSVTASNTDDDATFSFTDQVDVGLSTLITSSAVVVTGVDATLAVSITGGEYSLNGGAYTSSGGFVNNNDSITVQITSSASWLTAVEAVLTIGGSADTFTVTTEADTDGDDVGDSSDAFTDNIAASVDADNDGLPDEWNASCDTACQGSSGLILDVLLDDTDNDGVINANDAFPNNPAETTDSDGDGVGDNADAFPNDATETLDTDGDGVGNNADAFPNNIAASVDADNDGKPDEWNAACDATCQDSSGLILDVASDAATGTSTSSGGGGALSLMWLLLPALITAGRRRVS